jgi:hypothetical protein
MPATRPSRPALAAGICAGFARADDGATMAAGPIGGAAAAMVAYGISASKPTASGYLQALEAGARGVDAAGRFGSATFTRAIEMFRPVDVDGDGVPDKPRALTAVEDAGSQIKGVAGEAAGAFGSMFRRKRDRSDAPEEVETGRATDDT